MNFLVGVLSSIVAAMLLAVVSALLSRHARAFFISVLAKVLRIDMEAIFKNKQDAASDIEAALRRATHISLLTGRGNELQRGVFAELLGGPQPVRLQTLRIVLPHPHAIPNKTNPDWLAAREQEIAGFDRAYTGQLLKSQVAATIKYLTRPVQDGRAALRLLNFPHVGRILLTDSVVYVNQYSATSHGRDCEIVKFRRGGPMYDLCARVFEVLWSQAGEPSPSLFVGNRHDTNASAK